MAAATAASHGYLNLTPPGGIRIIPGVPNDYEGESMKAQQTHAGGSPETHV
jgi:hypothetical protein